VIRLGFVIPRYGSEILGGAEATTRSLVEHLPQPEFRVEVLSTCARDLVSWKNAYPPGLTSVNHVPVHRFPIEHRGRDERRYRELTDRFTNHWPMTVEEEDEWIRHSAHSPALYSYIAQRGGEYDLLIFGPYLFGTTLYGTALRPQQSILWPHLHDEPYAFFQQTRLMMQSCRGIMFNSEPEMVLARDKLGIRHPRACVVGEGLSDFESDPKRFRERSGLRDPFLLYGGRLTEAKNLLELLSFFIEYKKRRPGPLKLVLMGEGTWPIPAHTDVLSIGYQSERDKLDVYAAATVLCQPSLHESFSLVIMESWLAGVPVLVHGQCDVTRYHVLQSNGGLYYTSAAEFAEALDWFLAHPQELRRMGDLGRAYVRREFNWSAILDRFRQASALWSNPLQPVPE
jgi:glycosyltransferase involved in cell wall biosynthesis